jgi:hypothetical protein
VVTIRPAGLPAESDIPALGLTELAIGRSGSPTLGAAGDSECVDSDSFEDGRRAGCRVAVFSIGAISRGRVGEQRLVEPLHRAIVDILDRDLATTSGAPRFWKRLVARSATLRSSSRANYSLFSSLKFDENVWAVRSARSELSTPRRKRQQTATSIHDVAVNRHR